MQKKIDINLSERLLVSISVSLRTRSFFIEICSKFSMRTEINKFTRMNYPNMIKLMKNIEDM